MCTATFHLFKNESYLFFNRDELNNRTSEFVPKLNQVPNSFDWIAPVDGESGGTWLALGESGFFAGLLNDYQVSYEPRDLRSRGEIIPEIMVFQNQDKIKRFLNKKDFRFYKPFVLFFGFLSQKDLADDLNCLYWNGRVVTSFKWDYHKNPLVSSSYDYEEVVEYRKQSFNRLLLGERSFENVLQYHFKHHLLFPHQSVLMNRADASTKSVSCLVLKDNKLSFQYCSYPFDVSQRWQLYSFADQKTELNVPI